MVQAVETYLRKILEGSVQFQVPLYQRTYSWRKPQHQRLWEDVIKLADDRLDSPSVTHFIGSLVLTPSPSSNPGSTSEFLVVDGQQRLTTLTILLAAIRDHRAETEDQSHRDRINEQFLMNKWATGQPLKLLPTQKDRQEYEACIRSTPLAGSSHAIGSAYRYFRAELLSTGELESEVNVAQIEDAVLGGLALVSVVAESGDNVHRIFESLNNTGLRLTQGDLIRNYLFMRLPSRADAVYAQHWRTLEATLDSNQLELLFWLDLVQRNDNAKQSDTYSLQQYRLDLLQGEDAIEEEVKRFARLGSLMAVILDPSKEADSDVRLRLERLNAWGTATVYPLVLHLLDRRAAGEISGAQVSGTLKVVVSYLVRRVVIGRATANLNRTLLRSVQEIAGCPDPADALRDYLSVGRKHFATDREIRESIETSPFYWNGKANQRKLILQWIDENQRPKESIDPKNLTIEHVMPQTPTEDWREMIAESLETDEDVDSAYNQLLHTIGNLTLSGYNTELSNSSFSKKRDLLRSSGVWMNRDIADCSTWGRPQITERSKRLAEMIIEIWPGPNTNAEDNSTSALWVNLAKLLAEIPAGRWATYGDVAAVIGTHPVPLGNHLANSPVMNAHRVLRVDGRVAVNFKWPDPSRSDKPQDVLEREGVVFDGDGIADFEQRLSLDELAELAGLEIENQVELELGGLEREANFWAQVAQHQPAEVVNGLAKLLSAWRHLGGGLLFGDSQETSCFVLVDPTERRPWPFTVYPSGKIDVVFQHMSKRPPFDEVGLRQQFLDGLNAIDGIALPAKSLDKRPSFEMSLLSDQKVLDAVISSLGWFYNLAK